MTHRQSACHIGATYIPCLAHWSCPRIQLSHNLTSAATPRLQVCAVFMERAEAGPRRGAPTVRPAPDPRGQARSAARGQASRWCRTRLRGSGLDCRIARVLATLSDDCVTALLGIGRAFRRAANVLVHDDVFGRMGAETHRDRVASRARSHTGGAARPRNGARAVEGAPAPRTAMHDRQARRSGGPVEHQARHRGAPVHSDAASQTEPLQVAPTGRPGVMQGYGPAPGAPRSHLRRPGEPRSPPARPLVG